MLQKFLVPLKLFYLFYFILYSCCVYGIMELDKLSNLMESSFAWLPEDTVYVSVYPRKGPFFFDTVLSPPVPHISSVTFIYSPYQPV